MSGLVWLPVGAFSVLGLVLAANAVDTAIYAHGLLLVVACVLAGFAILKNGEKIVAEHKSDGVGGSPVCPSSKPLGRLSPLSRGGFGSSRFDVKPLGVDGSSGGFGS